MKIFIVVLVLLSLCSCADSPKTNSTEKKFTVQADLIDKILKTGGAENKNYRIDHNGILHQKQNTSISCYAYIPPAAQLKLQFDNTENPELTGTIQIYVKDHESIEIDLSKSRSLVLDLGKYHNNYAEIFLRVQSKTTLLQDNVEGQTVKWENLNLVTSERAAQERQGYSSKRKAITEKLHSLDIIYILFDAYSAQHSSAYGYDRKTAPFFEELASRNILFENMFSAGAYTLASTASLLTSSFSNSHGLSDMSGKLNPEVKTIFELTSTYDIRSFLLTGHGFVASPKWGLDRGYSKIFFRDYNNDSREFITTLETIYRKNADRHERRVTYLHLTIPHTPYKVPKKYRLFGRAVPSKSLYPDTFFEGLEINKISKTLTSEEISFVKDMYDSNVLFSDSILKDVYTFLSERKILEKSVVFVTADHGEAFMEHGATGHGPTVHDEVMHVPFLMIFPENLGVKNRRVSQLTSLIDVAPTFADILGIPQDEVSLGRSLLSPILDDLEIHDFVYGESPRRKHRFIRNKEYKLITTPEKMELFDIRNDPGEQKDISGQHPVITQYLSQELNDIFRRNSSSITVKENPRENAMPIDKEVLKSLKNLGYIK